LLARNTRQRQYRRALSPREREVLAPDGPRGRSNVAIRPSAWSFTERRRGQAHTASIFLKLDLQPSDDDKPARAGRARLPGGLSPRITRAPDGKYDPIYAMGGRREYRNRSPAPRGRLPAPDPPPRRGRRRQPAPVTPPPGAQQPGPAATASRSTRSGPPGLSGPVVRGSSFFPPWVPAVPAHLHPAERPGTWASPTSACTGTCRSAWPCCSSGRLRRAAYHPWPGPRASASCTPVARRHRRADARQHVGDDPCPGRSRPA